MKKIFMTAAMVVFAAMTASAQVSSNMTEEEFLGTSYPKSVNPGDYEFSPSLEKDRLNYVYETEKKRPHKDVIPYMAGNDLDGTELYTVDNHGHSLYLQAVGAYFNDYFAYGGGAGYGYEDRWYGFKGTFNLQVAKPDEKSDDQSTYLQERIDLMAYLKLAEWLNHHGGLKVGILGSLQLSQYIKENGWTNLTTKTTEDGKVTTTVDNYENVNLRDFVSGGGIFAEVYGRKAFSPWGWYLGVAGGLQQNILLNNNKFYPEVRIYFGIEFRFARHGAYNSEALKRCHVTESEVWNMREEAKPYQKPAKK
jgi:hypothetical protein